MASSPNTKPPTPNLATLLAIKRKMGTIKDPNSQVKQVQPPAATGSHSDEKLTYHQNMPITNQTIPEEPNESRKISRKTKQLEVGLLDKKMEEINRKQEATKNETLDSWKGFDSLNYGFNPHSATQNPTPVPSEPKKQPTPPSSPKRQPSPVKEKSPTPRQPTPKRVDTPVKDQPLPKSPVKEEKPPLRQKSPSPERKPEEKQPSPTPPREKSAKQKSPSPERKPEEKQPSPTPLREKSPKPKTPSPEPEPVEKQATPPPTPRPKSVNEQPPPSPIPREKTPEKQPTPPPRQQRPVDIQPPPPSPAPRQRPVEKQPSAPIPPPRRPKINSAPSLKKAKSLAGEPPKPSSAVIETTIPISLIIDNPQIFEKNVQPFEQSPISNNHPMKLFPDPKPHETKRSKNAYKSIQRSMDRYRFHLW